MSIVHEETRHAHLDVEFLVSERTVGEMREPWSFVSLEIDSMSSITPREMRNLGRWLIDEGRRLGREYKSNGAPRARKDLV
jgi:hypothetical protein